jgi:hypothetical protein
MYLALEPVTVQLKLGLQHKEADQQASEADAVTPQLIAICPRVQISPHPSVSESDSIIAQ